MLKDTVSKQPKRWLNAPDPPYDFTQALSDLGPVLAKILYNRGLTSPDLARQFLSDDIIAYDPFLMKDMSKAVARIRHAIRRKEPIAVYGDFDADGVTSTVLLIQTLNALGGQVEPYIPDRIDEGYGLNTPALQKLAAKGIKLVVTVDCGIRSVEEVKAAIVAGLDIIITDHHSVGEVIPPALAVLNPKQSDCKYPEDMLAGVGIAYKLASALLTVARQQDRNAPNLSSEDLLDLVALGTVADLAPLDRIENRSMVKLGLVELARARRPGIYALMDISKVKPEKVNATSIGFALGPRINAAGRLENALIAYQLLMTNDWTEATRLAQDLQEINARRQDYTSESYRIAKDLALQDGGTDNLIFAADASFKPGIVGLVAGKLTEEFYRPAVVIQIGEGESHGSCRSTPEFHITNALDECADLLVQHGGHAQAAGFTIRNENIAAFKERLQSLVSVELMHHDLRPSISIDAEAEMIDLTLALAENIRKLEPMGTDNPEPIFMTRRLRVVEPRRVGNDGSHLKLRLSDGPLTMDAIAFRFGDWYAHLPPYVDVLYNLQINEWNGRITPQMNVVDIRPSER